MQQLRVRIRLSPHGADELWYAMAIGFQRAQRRLVPGWPQLNLRRLPLSWLVVETDDF